MKQAKDNNNSHYIWLDCIFIAVLFVMPLIHVAFGVDFTDTGYSLGNYENLDNMNLTWTIATFWANILGQLFTRMPFGHLWIGMKFYTNLIPIAGSIVSYVFLKKYMPRVIVFLGEVLALALCWCPTTILYNYLTYLVFALVVVVLIKSLESENKIGLIIAGVLIGFNVFVRFPNVTEVSLIVVVWLDGMLKKNKAYKTLLNTVACVVGFFAGILGSVFIIGVKYGFSSITDMVISLFSMTKVETGYSPKAMVMRMLWSYYTYKKCFVLLITILVISFVLGFISRKHWLKIVACVIEIILFGAFTIWAYKNDIFSFRYDDYSSMYFGCIILLVLCNIFSITTVLRKNANNIEKLIALSSLVIIWITPLGSNNGLFPAYNNLFIVAPATLYMIWRELFKGRNFYELMDMESKNSMVSARILVALLVVCLFIQSTLFGFVFIFRDSGFPYNNNTPIHGNEVLKGMHTNKERAAIIEQLTVFVNENNLQDESAIFYGDIPSLEYILKMPCAISHTWPNLGSFTAEEFEKDIENLSDTPVIFVNEEVCPDIFDLSENSSTKECVLAEYMTNNNYVLVRKIDKIAIYMSK